LNFCILFISAEAHCGINIINIHRYQEKLHPFGEVLFGLKPFQLPWPLSITMKIVLANGVCYRRSDGIVVVVLFLFSDLESFE